ncbi:PAS domain-containing sensor histidine kinase [Pontibacter rugosus]|uniref:histidine kinase n=1 Tax=Pontibacter rugosus TaxID=1745966 RepID=A0ABW3SLZ0_9BACT
MPQTTPITSDFLANNVKLAIFVLDLESKQLVFTNATFGKLFNLRTGSKIEADALVELVHVEDRQHVVDTYHKLLAEKKGRDVEFRMQVPGQEVRWLCLFASIAADSSGKNLLVCSLDDVSANRQYNDYLNKYAAKKNSVLHVLAHDLAGPLGMINSLAELLAEETESLANQEIDNLIKLITKTSVNSVNLIRNLINHEFLETTGVDLIKRRVNMVEKFKEVMSQYQDTEKELQLTFQLVTSSTRIFADLDDVKFMQAINNLISNALKFTPKGGTVTVSIDEKEDSIRMKVEDNGIGIPAKYHHTLFDKFTDARRPGLNGEPTTGLGMSIIKTIVEWHQGEIWFESEVGRGTTFFIEIPKY